MALGQGMGPINLMIGNLSMGSRALDGARHGRSASPAADAARFNFTRSPEIAREVREQVIAALSRTNPANRPVFEKAFANDAVYRQFQAVLVRLRLSPTNFVDVTSAYSLITWQIATGEDADAIPAAQAVRAQLLRRASNNAALLNMPNAQKQRAAEWIAYQVVMDAAMLNAFRRQGDTAKVQALRAQVREAAMHIGPDPARLKLTKAGLILTP
jgi:hypothetical protein